MGGKSWWWSRGYNQSFNQWGHTQGSALPHPVPANTTGLSLHMSPSHIETHSLECVDLPQPWTYSPSPPQVVPDKQNLVCRISFQNLATCPYTWSWHWWTMLEVGPTQLPRVKAQAGSPAKPEGTITSKFPIVLQNRSLHWHYVSWHSLKKTVTSKSNYYENVRLYTIAV